MPYCCCDDEEKPSIVEDIITQDIQKYAGSIARVRRRCRLDQIENILQESDKPTDEDILVALMDAVNEMNQTLNWGSSWSIDQCLGSGDEGLVLTAELGACKYIIDQLYTHFAHSGFSMNSSEMAGYTVENHVQDLLTRYEKFSDDFAKRVEGLKATRIRHARRTSGVVNTGIINYTSHSITKRDVETIVKSWSKF